MRKVLSSITALFTFIAICHGQANQKLSNLVAPTAVNIALLPGGTTGTKNFGSATKHWKNGYFHATVYGYGTGSTYGVYGSNNSGGYGVYGTSNYLGVYGSGTSYGVYGYSGSGYGVVGSSGYIGVYGSGSSYGLYGSGGTYGTYSSGSSYGVYGTSTNGYGTAGVSTNSYGLYGSGYDGSVAYGSYIGAYGQGDSYGVYGYSSTNTGVYGYTGGGGSSYYGVYGYNNSTGYGVRGYCYSGSGVYGSSTNNYAGYFAGNVYATGTYQGSDEKLKQNIRDFTSAMDIINKLRPKEYEFRQDGDYKYMHLPAGSQYGLVANDVEKILPNLVKETSFDPNVEKTEGPVNPADKKAAGAQAAKSQIINFKALNYTEFIPIIIKGMQELYKENTDLRDQVAQLKQMISQNVSGASAYSLSGASLGQNFPNPFNKNTTISFSVPKESSSASLILTQTSTGKIIKTMPVSGASQVSLDAASLSAGAYTYTLYIDGKKVDSKQMIISK